MSQDLRVDFMTVCLSLERQRYSLYVSLNKAECVFIWQCSSVHMSDLDRNLLAHLVSLVPPSLWQ